jgi:hypothetical protein
MDSELDWHERRHELKPDMVFITYNGDIVKLDRSVPGDGTQWYVADWCNDRWYYEDGTIEPSDLLRQVALRPHA